MQVINNLSLIIPYFSILTFLVWFLGEPAPAPRRSLLPSLSCTRAFRLRRFCCALSGSRVAPEVYSLLLLNAIDRVERIILVYLINTLLL